MEESLDGRYSHGYYKWKEPNGEIRDKFMYIAPLNKKTADGVRFGVAATIYIDEFTHPILAAQDVSHSTSRYLMIALKGYYGFGDLDGDLFFSCHHQPSRGNQGSQSRQF
jgi:hypothetical protein